MNIHVSEETFKDLQKSILISIKMGSKLYGCETTSSDTDYLHIIATPLNWQHSLSWTHHNLQYKESGIDHVFCTIQNFVRNILKGDSTLNYESLFSLEFENSKELQFIYNRKHEFNNYKLMLAYLGLARRDLKQFSQSYDVKKLFHAARGFWSFERLHSNLYSNDLKGQDLSFWEFLMNIRQQKFSRLEMIEIMKELGNKVDSARKELGLSFEAGKINRLMNVETLEKLDQDLITFCKSEFYQSHVLENLSLSQVYSALETDIDYSKN